MPLAERRAYALHESFYEAVRRIQIPLAEGTLQSLHSRVLEHTRDLARDDVRPLDKFLQDSARSFEESVATIPKIDELDRLKIAEILGEFRDRIQRVDCQGCLSGRICNGDPDFDDEIVAAPDGGQCIQGIKVAFELAGRMAAEQYGPFIKKAAVPTILLSTEARISPPVSAGLNSSLGLAVNGVTVYEDNAEDKVSHVTIAASPRHINPFSLSALPHLLLHEVFCHGYQMARATSPRTGRGRFTDPISEGLMDLLVTKMFEVRKMRAVEKKDPDVEAVRRESSASHEIHLARASKDRNPNGEEASTVSFGVSCFENLVNFFKRHKLSDEDAHKDAWDLACEFNLHEWEIHERRVGVTRLNSRLVSGDRDLAAELARFHDTREARRVVELLLRG